MNDPPLASWAVRVPLISSLTMEFACHPVMHMTARLW